jgi:Protein of unknown function (DUF2924)
VDISIARQIEELKSLTVAELKVRYREVLGEQSRSSNKQFLFRRLAWQLQAKAESGLSERAHSRIASIADDTAIRVRAPKGFLSEFPTTVSPQDRSHAQRDWRLPAPGTLLTRRFERRDIIVKVLRQGFEYDGRRYRSLSAIAREITGTRWNGLLFFGLTERRNG